MNILTVILIIGVLVFVHELGHFLAAKSLKIPVKIFSIGFPLGNIPPLIRFNWNETECQLNALPLGGFCAFMDDEKTEDKDPNDQRYLSNRKIWERFVVISGGVFFNFVFAIIIAVVMYFSLGIPEGREFSDGVLVGELKNGSPADKAGIKSFDTIVEVDKVPLTFESDMRNVFYHLLKPEEGKNTVEVSYLNSNGEDIKKDLPLNKNNSFETETQDVTGILIKDVVTGKIGEKYGIKKYDVITEIGGKSFKGARNPEGHLKQVLSEQKVDSDVSVKVLRNGEEKDIPVKLDGDKKLGVSIEFIKGLLIKASENETVLPKNVIITEVNKNQLFDTSSLMKTLIAKHKDGSEAEILIERGKEKLTFKVVPEKGVIGVNIYPAAKEVRRPANSFVEPFVNAGWYIASTSMLLVDALLRMFTGNVSASEIGGPIMVVAKGAEIAQADFSKLFQFTIMISIELVILNIIPLPAVDGGHLFLLLVEKIRGRKLPKSMEEKIHYAGLLLLLGLGVFLILKDVLTLSRIIG
ncbi:MAG: site-2 protease family protein [Candidatus Sericytochromatia bacterium]